MCEALVFGARLWQRKARMVGECARVWGKLATLATCMAAWACNVSVQGADWLDGPDVQATGGQGRATSGGAAGVEPGSSGMRAVEPGTSTASGGDTQAGIESASSTGDTTSESSSGAALPPKADCNAMGIEEVVTNDFASPTEPFAASYIVTPGDPFCATIMGDGGGTWSMTIRDGTSADVLCTGTDACAVVVPPDAYDIHVTVESTSGGSFVLRVRTSPPM